MAENKLTPMVYGFIGIILAATLIISIADKVTKIDDASDSLTNSSTTMTASGNRTTGTLVEDDLISFSIARNLNNTECHNSTVSGCNVTLSTGTLACNVTGTNSTGGTGPSIANPGCTGNVGADYTYFPNDHVKDNTARSIIKLVVVFFALGALFIAVGGAMNYMKDWGL